jgi:hypothetical protein
MKDHHFRWRNSNQSRESDAGNEEWLFIYTASLDLQASPPKEGAIRRTEHEYYEEWPAQIGRIPTSTARTDFENATPNGQSTGPH